MPPDNPDQFFEMVPTRFGPRFVARPETIAGVFHHDRDIAEGMMKTRQTVKTLDGVGSALRTAASGISQLSTAVEEHRDAFPGAAPPPTKRPAFAKPKTRTPTADDPLPDESEMPGGRDDHILAELPAPPDGMHYDLEPRPDGGWCVIVEPGDPDGMGGPLTGDGRRRDPKLVRMNRDAARYWRDRGGKTRDADVERTVAMFGPPGEGGRYELRENPNGSWYVIWTTPDPSDDMINGVSLPGTSNQRPGFGSRPATPQLLLGNTPFGGYGDGPEIRSGSSAPSRAGDHLWYGARARQRDAAKLKMMNAAAKRMWNSQGRVR